MTITINRYSRCYNVFMLLWLVKFPSDGYLLTNSFPKIMQRFNTRCLLDVGHVLVVMSASSAVTKYHKLALLNLAPHWWFPDAKRLNIVTIMAVTITKHHITWPSRRHPSGPASTAPRYWLFCLQYLFLSAMLFIIKCFHYQNPTISPTEGAFGSVLWSGNSDVCKGNDLSTTCEMSESLQRYHMFSMSWLCLSGFVYKH